MGSPNRACADQTRANILKVSQKLFAEKGFAGTSISQIAKLAEVNQSLIYHHFESKEGLWKRVKGDMLADYLSCQDEDFEALFATDDIAAFIEKITRMRFKFYDENPDIRRMIKWQELDDKKMLLQGGANKDYQRLRDKMANFHQRGCLKQGLSFDMAFALLISTPKVYFAQQFRLEQKLTQEQIVVQKELYLNVVIDGLQHMLMRT